MSRKHFYMMMVLILGLVSQAGAAYAEDIQARWRLENPEALLGQSLKLILEVRGTDQVSVPQFQIPGVVVTWQGGRPNSSTSVVSINGRTTTTLSKSFLGVWTLKASRAGSYHFDGLDLVVGAKTIHLEALDWTVSAGESDERFFLKQGLNQNVTIPGLELEYSLVWYLGQGAQNPEFTLPILDSPLLEVVPDSLKAPAGDVFQLDYHGQTLSGLKGTTSLGGHQFTTLSFKFRVKAKAPGRIDLTPTMVSFAGAVATRQTQDFFGNIVDEPAYKNISAQANPLVLEIKDLPVQGKPAPFSGLIGTLKLSWSGIAGPYQVGEPIHLRLKLDGVLNKPNLDLDSMITTALNDLDFQVSTDPAGAAATGAERAFVFRARHGGHLSIPALKLNYYDPKTERYDETTTPAIALDIQESAVAATSGANPALTIAGPANPTNPAPGVALNPPGLPGALPPHFPWWYWALPGTLFGLVLGGLGLWRHSRWRQLQLARATWLSRLAPLQSADDRGQLEEARTRLQELLLLDDPWRQHLEKAGHWQTLQETAAEWDRAFFDQGREAEPWSERWTGLASEVRGWK